MSYVVSYVSQFLEAPRISHWEAIIQILHHLKHSSVVVPSIVSTVSFKFLGLLMLVGLVLLLVGGQILNTILLG